MSAEQQPLNGYILGNEQEDHVARGIMELYLVGRPTIIAVYAIYQILLSVDIDH